MVGKWKWVVTAHTRDVSVNFSNFVVNSTPYFSYRDFTWKYFGTLTTVGTCVNHVH